MRCSNMHKAPCNTGNERINTMGYWCSLHLFDDTKFYRDVVPELKGETGDLSDACEKFLRFHVIGGIAHLQAAEIKKRIDRTIEHISAISCQLDNTFKIHREFHTIKAYDQQKLFLNDLDGYDDFCRFLEYYVFKTCADFFPHIGLGKGGVSRNFDLPVNSLSYSIVAELDGWNDFLSGAGMGITNWISHEDVELLYLDKENLHYTENKRAEGFLTLLETARDKELGLIAGVDMREDQLELLPGNKLINPVIWEGKAPNGLIFQR